MTDKEKMITVIREINKVQDKIWGLNNDGVINKQLLWSIQDKIDEARNYLSGYAETVKDLNEKVESVQSITLANETKIIAAKGQFFKWSKSKKFVELWQGTSKNPGLLAKRFKQSNILFVNFDE